ncbi:hypothetical protein [Halolamina sp. C58]|uniref:hypothetical protein n=1 Tax=Halolamina sp. C58 TaxID=3421640 RepID=UPI003EBBEF92
MGQCRFTFDRASGEEAPESLDGWSCPHESHPDAERCVFHLSPAEREELGVGDEAVLDAFLDRALGSGEEPKQFVGAQFGEMDLRRQIVAADDRHPIDLRSVTPTSSARRRASSRAGSRVWRRTSARC